MLIRVSPYILVLFSSLQQRRATLQFPRTHHQEVQAVGQWSYQIWNKITLDFPAHLDPGSDSRAAA